jgi:dGTPase
MFETREGILKHCSPSRARELGDLGQRFLENRQPSLEAQICNLADEIAYNNHDVDDGLRSGVLTLEQLQGVSLFARHSAEVETEFPRIAGRRRVHETIRRMIDAQVTDLLAESGRRIGELTPASLDDVHRAPPLIGFTAAMEAENRELKSFLREHLYRHFEVLRMTAKARRVIHDLFGSLRFRSAPAAAAVPGHGRGRNDTAGDGRLHCRHDRPLLDEGTSAPVRRQRVLRPVAALQRIEIRDFWRYI